MTREELFKKQKEERGWSDDETWSLDNTLALYILPRLKRFKELHCGHPESLTSEKWNEYLDKMIASFSLYDTNDDSVPLMITEEQHEGFKLFGEYFFDLWW